MMRDVRKKLYRFGALMQQAKVWASSCRAVSMNCMALVPRLDL